MEGTLESDRVGVGGGGGLPRGSVALREKSMPLLSLSLFLPPGQDGTLASLSPAVCLRHGTFNNTQNPLQLLPLGDGGSVWF